MSASFPVLGGVFCRVSIRGADADGEGARSESGCNGMMRREKISPLSPVSLRLPLWLSTLNGGTFFVGRRGPGPMRPGRVAAAGRSVLWGRVHF